MNQENKRKNIVPLKDLNLTSRFLFDQVMEDPQEAPSCDGVHAVLEQPARRPAKAARPASGEMLYMTVGDLYGDETGWTAFAEKFRMGRLIPELSSYKQKASAATWGCVIRRPSLVATMLGI